jgi:hypothetical protein
MQVTVTYLGVPVLVLDVRVARTLAGAVALGLGVQLGGYAAYRTGGRDATEALELHDAYGALIPTTGLRVWRLPFGRRVVVFAHFRDALAGVPARLEPALRGGTAAAHPSPRADDDGLRRSFYEAGFVKSGTLGCAKLHGRP